MNTIQCVGKDGVTRTFYVAVQNGSESLELALGGKRTVQWWSATACTNHPSLPEDDFFTAHAVRLDESTVMSKEIHANSHAGKGIPEAWISLLKNLTGSRIISSSSKRETRIFANEKQSPQGLAVWVRMARNGLAKELPSQNRYEYIGQ